ncbi:tryptophan--tRNA ligase [Desmospora sp. 8437]|nr:tryptophan--tRNA ligase [Desmospora sp. 8437]
MISTDGSTRLLILCLSIQGNLCHFWHTFFLKQKKPLQSGVGRGPWDIQILNKWLDSFITYRYLHDFQ